MVDGRRDLPPAAACINVADEPPSLTLAYTLARFVHSGERPDRPIASDGAVSMPHDSGIHVVVLDESPVLATALGGAFARAGYRASAPAAIEVGPAELLRLRPDLLVLDVQGGFGRGMGLLRELRAHPAGRDVPVLASPTITPNARRVYAADLQALHAVVLPDPFAVDDLLAAAGAAVARSQAMRRRSDAALARLYRILNQRLPE
jgi:DNA-binding NarL/FixJ family response regulator